VPATPRDGAAIEIIGLLKSALRWLTELRADGLYRFDGVRLASGASLSWHEWNERLQQNFERHFWVPTERSADADYHIDSAKAWVNRRGIYRDSFGSTHGWTDFQLRPNVCVAMAVAPELFDEAHARAALARVGSVLLGKLGMKTLDPSDWNYRPRYDNDVDSHDYNTAKGFNYHNGPEWLWLVGYYFRARLRFTPSETLAHQISMYLQPHQRLLRQSAWQGLPELTNVDGEPCSFSCPSQAWSSASLLSVLFDVRQSVDESAKRQAGVVQIRKVSVGENIIDDEQQQQQQQEKPTMEVDVK
jgi:glycogen debranching enzyme